MCIFYIEKVLYFSYSPTSTYMIWVLPQIDQQKLVIQVWWGWRWSSYSFLPRPVALMFFMEILLQNKWNWWITFEQSKKQINVKLTVKTFLLFICCQLFSWDDSLWNYVFFNVLAQEFNTLWSMWKTYPWLNHTVWSEVCASSISM